MAKSKGNTKVTSLNQETVKALLAACEEALEPVAERFGLVLTRGNCRYRDDEVPMPFKMMLGADQSATDSPRDAGLARDFVRHAAAFGLDPEWLGKTFEIAGSTYEIIGLRPRAPKFPVVVRKPGSENKAQFTFPAEVVEAAMRPGEAPAPMPGATVRWKSEETHAGPAWLDDPARPNVRLRIEIPKGRARPEVVEVDAKKGLGDQALDGHLIGWIPRGVAMRYAQTIGAAFEEV